MLMEKLILVTTVTSHPRRRTTGHDPAIVVETRLPEFRLRVIGCTFYTFLQLHFTYSEHLPSTKKKIQASEELATGGICSVIELRAPAYRSVYSSLGWLKRLHFRHARCFLLSSAYKQLGYGLCWSSTWKIHITVGKVFSVSLI